MILLQSTTKDSHEIREYGLQQGLPVQERLIATLLVINRVHLCPLAPFQMAFGLIFRAKMVPDGNIAYYYYW